MNFKLLLAFLLGISIAARADLLVNVDAPKTVGQKTLVKLALKNTFPEKIESARAVAFLLDEHGKMVSQSTKWVIGGTKGSPALESSKETTFNFVLQSHGSASTNMTTKVSFSQVTLEGGKQADINKAVQIQNAKSSGNQ
jgi:hypothetical protein